MTGLARFFCFSDAAVNERMPRAPSITVLFIDTQRRAFRSFTLMRLYVGGFPYATTKEELTMLFSEVGEVSDIHLPFDKISGRPRGFGFIEMPDDAARAAIERFHGTDFGGRTLTVNEAQPRAERPQGDRPRFDRGSGDDRRGGFDRRADRSHAPREEAPAVAEAEAPVAEEAVAADADMDEEAAA